MGENEDRNDAEFVAGLMRHVPSTPVPSSLQARILHDYDRMAAKRAPGALTRLLQRWRDAIWPGAPLWQPASLLVLSLVIGLMTGTLVPASTLSASASTADQTLTADDTTSALDLYKDL